MNESRSHEVGTYQWVSSGGHLSAGDRLRLFRGLAGTARDSLRDIWKLWASSTPQSVAQIDSAMFNPPDSRLARKAEEAWQEQRSPTIRGHALRSWMYGQALAAIDGSDVDREAFYCAALLHDYGLDRGPIPGVDFTLIGADRARRVLARAELPDDIVVGRQGAVADAICLHATAGISVAPETALAYYVMVGSMADAAALRRWHVGVQAIKEIHSRAPTGGGFKSCLNRRIWHEAFAVPAGRFAMYAFLGMTLLIRLAPSP